MKTALLVVLLAPASWAAAVDCRTCHTTDAPTREKPSLVKCPRAKLQGKRSVDGAPAELRLGKGAAPYGPVKFSHKAHASMADMGQGCTSCHHYNQARPIQGCADCHPTEKVREDLGKPEVSAAIHRLCVDCHRRWAPEAGCASCHDAAKERPPKAALPEKIVYETAGMGKPVSFAHASHAKGFGQSCASCHKAQSCASCHGPEARASAEKTLTRQPDRIAPLKLAHAACASCHKEDSCSKCHSKGESGFDHRRAGLALDEVHGSLNCETCHESKPLTGKLSCGGCHEGRSYPKDKPGKPVPRPAGG